MSPMIGLMSDATLFPDVPGDSSSGRVPPRPLGAPRLQRPERHQMRWVSSDLDGLLAPDHRARAVWAYVEGLDLSAFYGRILAVEGHAGRSPIDPAILVALWLYATLESVGSARALARLCEEHNAYRWICGGVGVNHHTLAAFRSEAGEPLDRLLSETLGVMMKEGFVHLDRVAQDGLRVRAEAGSASFRRGGSLKGLLRTARRHVRKLKEELHDDPQATSRRQAAARERAAAEREEFVKKALESQKKIAELREKDSRRKESAKDARASTTDPDARLMKMADGGFRPAYNVQFATDTASKLIVGVEATNQGRDAGELAPMCEQIERRLGRKPAQVLADTGFVRHEDIERLSERGTATYAPVTTHGNDPRGPFDPHPGEGPGVSAWRRRMGTTRGKRIYRERGPTAEWVNAQARNRGLRRVFVRGLEKVRAICLWYAIAHNMAQSWTLRRRRASALA